MVPGSRRRALGTFPPTVFVQMNESRLEPDIDDEHASRNDVHSPPFSMRPRKQSLIPRLDFTWIIIGLLVLWKDNLNDSDATDARYHHLRHAPPLFEFHVVSLRVQSQVRCPTTYSVGFATKR